MLTKNGHNGDDPAIHLEHADVQRLADRLECRLEGLDRELFHLDFARTCVKEDGSLDAAIERREAECRRLEAKLQAFDELLSE
ncbi:MAG: hypothetical protein V2I43_02140 [Parvularcula sp.]|nr:hypothetical protein [Parvularcula sp.]